MVALWTIAAHPLAGLPLFGATILILMNNSPCPLFPKERVLTSPFWKGGMRELAPTLVVYLFTIFSVPCAFALNTLISHAAVNWNLGALFHASPYANLLSSIVFPLNHLALWADWGVMVQFLFPLLLAYLLFLAIAKNGLYRRLWILLSSTGAGLMLAGFFLRATGGFSFLIDYERGNFADRLFVIAALVLLMPALNGFAILMDSSASWRMRGNDKSKLLIAALLTIGAFWMAGQAYLALPRHDATITGHGWSVGTADQKAVKWIEADANGQPYTVLANQTVSAAAVEAFGFKRYVSDIFYYPIPTGGPLYQLYLKATSEPTRDIVKQAADLGHSRLVYVVLNNYWWDAARVTESLRQIADLSTTIGDGAVTIYRFDTKP